MWHKTAVFASMAITLGFVHATLSLQGAVMPIAGPAYPPAINLKIKDQKNIFLEFNGTKPLSFWYELVMFSKKRGGVITMSDVVGIENDGAVSRFILYDTNKGGLGIMWVKEGKKGFFCAIRRTPRSGGAYATLTFQAPCGAGSGEPLANIEVILLKATSAKEKYAILKNGVARLIF